MTVPFIQLGPKTVSSEKLVVESELLHLVQMRKSSVVWQLIPFLLECLVLQPVDGRSWERGGPRLLGGPRLICLIIKIIIEWSFRSLESFTEPGTTGVST